MDRAAPLSSRQRRVLVQLVEERPVLQDRSTSTAVQHKKNLAWDEIAKNFNAMHPDLEPRSVQQLKRSFNRIKLNVKKEERAYKLKVKRTGGAPPPSPPKFTEEHETVASMISGELNMGEDVFDTLAIQDGHPVDEAGTPIMDVTFTVSGKLPPTEVPSATSAAECAEAPAPPSASTSFQPEASSSASTAPSLTTFTCNVASSSAAPRQRRKFDAEYQACRKQQDEYHQLLLQQTREEHDQQMKLYQFHREVLQRQLDVFTETWHHIREAADTCKAKFLDSLGNA
ncbi:uncharacterized protein LOC126989585 [Eriocheir sinensis]|uniref:uncharacterized protein LOC126989585 n=1 Tax=Eriocheir sinensis TaxID=95602 RepID=UPI0021C7FD69|nr:uncharacterized protein LOC126989585 [Eriocheir sinensis]